MDDQINNKKPVEGDGTGMSITALVLGIVGIVGGFIPIINYFTLVCSLLGLIFGIIGRRKSINAYGKASGMAIAGMVLGIISLSLSVIVVSCISCVILSRPY